MGRQPVNTAKEILAFELTMMVHGEEEAQKAQQGARALFAGGGDTANMPSSEIGADAFSDGAVSAIDLLMMTGLTPSRGEARRLIEQGGMSVDGEKVSGVGATIPLSAFEKGHIIVKKGKKVYHKVILK